MKYMILVLLFVGCADSYVCTDGIEYYCGRSDSCSVREPEVKCVGRSNNE